MKSRYVCTWSANVGDINRNKLRFGYSGMRFQIRVSIQGSGTRISGYPLRSLVRMCRCATSWCDLDLTFDLAVVTLTVKILSGLYLGNRKV